MGLSRGGATGPGLPGPDVPTSGVLLTQGLFPAGIRLIPHTVLTFLFLEQLRKHFGIRVPT